MVFECSIDDLMRMTYQQGYFEKVLGLMPNFDVSQLGRAVKGDLMKADDPFYTTKTAFFNPIYGAAVFSWLNLESDIWRLLPKETFQQKGDSFRVESAGPTNFWGQLETAASLGDTDIMDLTKITVTKPAVMYNHWNASLIAQLQSTWQDSPRKNFEVYARESMAEHHLSNMNAKLGMDCDTLACGGGNFDNYIESIDRVCSSQAESALLSDGADNDIYGLDRSAGVGEAYCDLNGGVNRDLSLGLIDDMLGDCKKYSKNKRFILITDESQVTRMEALEGVKHRIGDQAIWKIDTVNGVNTRKGVSAGFAMSSYIGAGIEVPIFTSKDIHAESGGSGNIYLLDLDRIAIRVAMPTVYLDTQNQHFLLLDAFQYKYMYLTLAQLVATQFNCHGAIKYLN